MKKWIGLLILFFGSGCLFAQDTGHRQSIDSAAVMYLQKIGEQSALYNGKEEENYPKMLNDPYYVDWKFAKARLSYNGVIYPEALLRLDLYRDDLIIISPHFHQFVLFPENVDFVELHARHIIYFRQDSLPGCPSSGYYFLLHSGACKVLEKQSFKTKYNDRSELIFVPDNSYYLYKDGVYHVIRNRRGLLNVLQPYGKQLKRFISSLRLRFGHDAERIIQLAVSEYEKIAAW